MNPSTPITRNNWKNVTGDMSKIWTKKVVFFFSSSKINKYYFIILTITLLFSLGGLFWVEISLDVVLSREGCNILNFWPNTYGHKPHFLWCYFEVLFGILGLGPHCTWAWWFFLYIWHNPIAYVIYIWFHVLGMDPEAHNSWDVLCCARSSGAHGYLMFLLSEKL